MKNLSVFCAITCIAAFTQLANAAPTPTEVGLVKGTPVKLEARTNSAVPWKSQLFTFNFETENNEYAIKMLWDAANGKFFGEDSTGTWQGDIHDNGSSGSGEPLFLGTGQYDDQATGTTFHSVPAVAWGRVQVADPDNFEGDTANALVTGTQIVDVDEEGAPMEVVGLFGAEVPVISASVTIDGVQTTNPVVGQAAPAPPDDDL